MITVQTYYLLLLIQVTAISVVALAMIFVLRQSAAMRHTIALTGIVLVLMSPLVRAIKLASAAFLASATRFIRSFILQSMWLLEAVR